MSTLWYGIRQGVKSIVQNKMFSLAAIGTITACLFILGVFYALFSNFQHMVYNAESTVGIIVFFNPEVTQGQIDSIGKEILLCKDVENVEYVSADEAWQRFQKELIADGETDTSGLANTFGQDNPLADSASYEVYLNNISNQAEVVDYIKKLDGVRKVNGSDNTAASLNSFNNLVAYVSITIIVLLILISVFLISSAVDMGINVRKDEIAIMKLIGATDLFVRLPFMIEGILMGLVGATIPLLLLRILYGRVIAFIVDHFHALSEWLTFVSVHKEFEVLLPLSLCVGVGIGWIGSAVSVRKHLHI